MEKISIIIPTFNVETRIKKCIESIISQITKQDEIIVIDDASTDNTYKVLCELNEEYQNLKIIRNEKNKGVSYSRNVGLKNSTGEILFFIDGDDICDDTMIEKNLKIYKKTKTDIICSGFIYKNEESQEERTVIPNIDGLYEEKIDMYEELLKYEQIGLIYSLANKMYLKKIIDENEIKFDESISNLEDYEFNLQYIKKCNSIYFLKEALYYYINSKKESLSSKYVKDLYIRYDNIKKEREDFYKQYLKTKNYEQQIRKINVKYLFNCVNNLYRKSSISKRKERVNVIKEIKKREEVEEFILKKEHNQQRYLKMMSNMLKLKNAYIIDFNLRILHFFKKNFSNIYITIFRKKLTKENT